MKTAALILAVGGGGVIGAVLRLGVSELVRRLVTPAWVFWGTTLVNLCGCFLIGVLGVLSARGIGLSPLWYRFLITGILGSLTTFSAFAWETTELFRSQRSAAALCHIGVNLLAGLLLVGIGIQIGESLAGSAAGTGAAGIRRGLSD